jgi:hypothetical protein
VDGSETTCHRVDRLKKVNEVPQKCQDHCWISSPTDEKNPKKERPSGYADCSLLDKKIKSLREILSGNFYLSDNF